MGLFRTLTVWSTLFVMSPFLIPLGFMALFFSPVLLPTMGLMYLMRPRARKVATSSTAPGGISDILTGTTAQPPAGTSDITSHPIIDALAIATEPPAGPLGEHASMSGTIAGGPSTSSSSMPTSSKSSFPASPMAAIPAPVATPRSYKSSGITLLRRFI